MSGNVKALTIPGAECAIMGPAKKVCKCLIHWNHDDCTDECEHNE